ncbi:uncharacterized protein MONOS_3333 [Monocercomonoides exilis]|uniref:uncharacterized protein n=1 Tax=Monocercomonoides exilis TaxID=2049356 RepID=UPI003559B391|nr:hypothetical protein MONOS_3333 [Monocercomonoides exilis]|eukprot:MONOS_3333.1-p1 / transcript=MONOS_3333.1 / gene=MONOS_3333 / organism=Monocercomonoides_exilis_PA203 / gene_product=unspecified product / transcript_product=unspecified product / location=Mono_scaffold00077:115494-116211(+) / protein_length=157 / sequence_SO=supercontig / SO=protein_coding / is_pseudo=false
MISKEKKIEEDNKSSSTSVPAIDPSDVSVVVDSCTSVAAINNIERLMRIVWISNLFDPSLLLSAIARLVSQSPKSRCMVVKQNDKVIRRGVAVCEVGEIVEKGLSAAGLRMEDVVLSPAAIALAVLEEREEAEEGEKGGKEGGKEGEQKGEEEEVF